MAGLMTRKASPEGAGTAGAFEFDAKWYLETYPDVAAAGMDPLDHYVSYGEKEGRLPCRPDSGEKDQETLRLMDIRPHAAHPLVSALPGVPAIDSPFFEQFADQIWSGETLAVARQLNKNGYAVIDFPEPDLDAIIEGLRNDLHPRYEWDKWRAGAVHDLRIQDAWKFDKRVQAIAANQKVLELLTNLYGRRAFPFQTLNFAVGTQQAMHSDHVHFNSAPGRFMCGVWLAFEDLDDDNGPLFYFPGSHKWQSYENEHLGVGGPDIKAKFPHYARYVDLWGKLAETGDIKPETFRAKKGQALIWSSNLVHGGSPLNDPNRTRWSQVTHYFFYGCGFITPLACDIYQGKIYYRDMIDIGREKPVPNMVSGHIVSAETRDRLK